MLLKEVNVVWLCKILSKKLEKRYFVKVSKNAICDSDNHWICDCGNWTTGEDNFHIPIQSGLRTVAYIEIDENNCRKICFDD